MPVPSAAVLLSASEPLIRNQTGPGWLGPEYLIGRRTSLGGVALRGHGALVEARRYRFYRGTVFGLGVSRHWRYLALPYLRVSPKLRTPFSRWSHFEVDSAMTLDLRSHSSFRSHAKAWLTLAPPVGGGSATPIQIGGYRALVTQGVACREGMSIDSVVLARGDFHAGTGCRFNKPIYVAGNCHVGKGCRLDAISVEGDLILGPGASVARWAEAGRLLDMRSGSSVRVAAMGGRTIQLGIDASAGTLTAPEIATIGRVTDLAESPRVAQSIDIPPPSSGELPQLGWVRGFKLEKLSPLGAETWLYDGSLHFPMPVYLRSKLVVRGSFVCPPGSFLGDDIKTGDSLRVGRGSVCKGNLTSRSDLILERDCLFEGDLASDRSLRLSSGVRGLRLSSGLVRVTAKQGLTLEPNVVVRGQLSSPQMARASEPALEGGLELLLAGG